VVICVTKTLGTEKCKANTGEKLRCRDKREQREYYEIPNKRLTGLDRVKKQEGYGGGLTSGGGNNNRGKKALHDSVELHAKRGG